MGTILEFDEIPEGSQLGVTTTDRGVISGRAIAVPVIPAPPTPPTPSTIGGVVTFLTVARSSASRMLDAPLSMVAAWIDGQPLYTSSFGGAEWHWQKDFPAATATDNETTCRPSSWIAGGLPGAAVRNLEGNRVPVAQAAWFVDATAADNEGAGSAPDPVKTDIEIVRRWGRGTVQIAVPVTINYVNSPAAASNFDVALLAGASITWLGAMGAPSKVGNITAVTVQNRATQTPWDVTVAGLGAADVRKFIRITASGTPGNVGAYATVLKDLGGGKVRVTPFGKAIVDAANSFVLVTPLVGDTIEIVEPSVSLQPGRIAIQTAAAALPGASPRANCFVFDSLLLTGGGFLQEFIGGNGVFGYVFRCNVQSQNFGGNGYNAPCVISGGMVTVTCKCVAGALVDVTAVGMFAQFQCSGGGRLSTHSDTTFQGVSSPYNVNNGTVESNGTAFFDSTGAGLSVDGGFYLQLGGVPDWGTANTTWGVRVRSLRAYEYTTKPTVNGGLGAGREARIGGTDKLYTAIPYIEPTNNAAMVPTTL